MSEAWTKAAAGYHKIVSPELLPFSKDAMNLLPPTPNSKVLEVACGSGNLSLQLAKRKLGCEITATDFSQGFIDIVNSAIEKKYKSVPSSEEQKEEKILIKTQVEDALSLSGIGDNSQDYLYSIFGIFILPDRVTALKAAKRVLVDGGYFVASGWDFEDAKDKAATVRVGTMNKTLMSSLPERFRPPAGAKSLFSLNATTLLEEVISVGFKDAKLYAVSHTKCIPSKEKLFELFGVVTPQVTNALNQSTAEELEHFKAELVKCAYKVDDVKLAVGCCTIEFPAVFIIARK